VPLSTLWERTLCATSLRSGRPGRGCRAQGALPQTSGRGREGGSTLGKAQIGNQTFGGIRNPQSPLNPARPTSRVEPRPIASLFSTPCPASCSATSAAAAPCWCWRCVLGWRCPVWLGRCRGMTIVVRRQRRWRCSTRRWITRRRTPRMQCPTAVARTLPRVCRCRWCRMYCMCRPMVLRGSRIARLRRSLSTSRRCGRRSSDSPLTAAGRHAPADSMRLRADARHGARQ